MIFCKLFEFHYTNIRMDRQPIDNATEQQFREIVQGGNFNGQRIIYKGNIPHRIESYKNSEKIMVKYIPVTDANELLLLINSVFNNSKNTNLGPLSEYNGCLVFRRDQISGDAIYVLSLQPSEIDEGLSLVNMCQKIVLHISRGRLTTCNYYYKQGSNMAMTIHYTHNKIDYIIQFNLAGQIDGICKYRDRDQLITTVWANGVKI